MTDTKPATAGVRLPVSLGDKDAENQSVPFIGELSAAPSPSKSCARQCCACPDVIFTILFVLHLGAVCFVGVWAYQTQEFTAWEKLTGTSFQLSHWPQYLSLLGASVGLCCCVATLYFALSLKAPGFLVFFSVVVMWLLFAAGIILSFYNHLWGSGITLIIVGCFFVVVSIFWLRASLDFTAICLQTATRGIISNFGTFFAALFVLLLQLGYSVLLFFALISLLTRHCDDNQHCEQDRASWMLLLPFVWTMEVLHNVLHVTVSGAIGSFYFQRRCGTISAADAGDGLPTLRALGRALGPSFGAICFGSLFVAIISFLRFIVNSIRYNSDNCVLRMLACFVDCLLSCVEAMLRIFNRFVYAYVGLYGDTYLEAAERVKSRVLDAGIDAILTDGMASLVCTSGTLFCAMLSGLGSYLWMKHAINASSSEVLTVSTVVALLALMTSYLLLSVLSSAVVSLFVCFAEQPGTLQAYETGLFASIRGIVHRYDNTKGAKA